MFDLKIVLTHRLILERGGGGGGVEHTLMQRSMLQYLRNWSIIGDNNMHTSSMHLIG